MVDVVLAELEEWSVRSGNDVDLGEAEMLLCMCRDHLGAREPDGLAAGDLRYLLLEIYPRKVAVSGDELSAVVPTARRLLDFLVASGRLPRRTHTLLTRELDVVEPQFSGAVDDSAQWGAARQIVEAMITDGIDVSDPAAMQDWVTEFNRNPPEPGTTPAGGSWAGTDDGESMPALPPVRVAPVGELAATARGAVRLAEVARLARWVSSRCAPTPYPLTATAVLRRADARAVIDELDLIPVAERGTSASWPRSAADVFELHELWCLAQETGMLEVVADHVMPGLNLPVLDDGTDEAILEIWYRTFCWVLDRPAGRPVSEALAEVLIGDQLPGLLVLLYAAEQPVVVDELVDELARDAWLPVQGEDDEQWGTELAQALRAGFAGLATALGAVEIAGDRVALGALGTWGLRRRLIEEGYDAPAVGALAGAPAVELLDGIGGHSEEAAEEEITAWLAGRDPRDAARGLVDAARNATPVRRQLAFALLDQVPAVAEQVVRTALDEPKLRPYAAVWLANRELDPLVEPSAEETSWLLIDMGAALIDTGDPACLAEQLGLEIPAGELARRMTDLWRVDHPRVADVLSAIGDHHPDPAVAKAARKASFRARSRALTR